MPLDNTVFTPPAPQNYVAPIIQSILNKPDPRLIDAQIQKAELDRKIALAKYEEDRIKAAQFLEMYPTFRAAQIEKLKQEASTRQGMLGYMQGLRASQILRNSSAAAAQAAKTAAELELRNRQNSDPFHSISARNNQIATGEDGKPVEVAPSGGTPQNEDLMTDPLLNDGGLGGAGGGTAPLGYSPMEPNRFQAAGRQVISNTPPRSVFAGPPIGADSSYVYPPHIQGDDPLPQ